MEQLVMVAVSSGWWDGINPVWTWVVSLVSMQSPLRALVITNVRTLGLYLIQKKQHFLLYKSAAPQRLLDQCRFSKSIAGAPLLAVYLLCCCFSCRFSIFRWCFQRALWKDLTHISPSDFSGKMCRLWKPVSDCLKLGNYENRASVWENVNLYRLGTKIRSKPGKYGSQPGARIPVKPLPWNPGGFWDNLQLHKENQSAV